MNKTKYIRFSNTISGGWDKKSGESTEYRISGIKHLQESLLRAK